MSGSPSRDEDASAGADASFREASSMTAPPRDDTSARADASVQEPSSMTIPLPEPTVRRSLPPEIRDLILERFISKPALHFAGFELKITEITGTIDIRLSRWSRWNMESGYVSSDIVRSLCRSAQQIAERRRIQPSQLVYHGDERATVDSATDLLCLVYPLTPVRRVLSLNQPINWWDFTGNAQTLGDMQHAGILVTKAVWCIVLGHWFIQGFQPSRYFYYPRMHAGELSLLAGCFSDGGSGLQSFCAVITDISEEDWRGYYSKFPVTFHDHNGSYAEAYETPIHSSIIDQLWGENVDLAERLTLRSMSSGSQEDMQFARRVDSQMNHKLRVSLLCGLLADIRPNVPRVRVLARKPVTPYGIWTAGFTRDIPTLGPSDPFESSMIKGTLDWIMDESCRRHRLMGSDEAL